MLDDPDELEHWITYIRFSAGPSSAESVMRQDKDTDIRRVLPVVQAPTLVLHRTGDQVEEINAGRYVASKIPDARFVELAGVDGIPWLGDAGACWTRSSGSSPAGREPSLPDRRLATVLFTDIVGSTEHVVSLGDTAWQRRLAEHDAIVRRNSPAVRPVRRLRRRRRAGDVRRAGRRRAVRPADHARARGRSASSCARGPTPARSRSTASGVHGVAVHIGARIAALAGPGEVLVSSVVRDLTAGSGLTFEDAGEHELKGIPDRWRLFRVVAPSTTRDERDGER